MVGGYEEINMVGQLVIASGKYIASHCIRMLCVGPDTQTKWKSESVTDLPTYITRAGSRDGYAFKRVTVNGS